jgi:hypothetical protein
VTFATGPSEMTANTQRAAAQARQSINAHVATKVCRCILNVFLHSPRLLSPKLAPELLDFVAVGYAAADQAKGLLPDGLRLRQSADN